MSHKFDATLKHIVAAYPQDFLRMLGLPATDAATVLNVDLSTISAATDVAFGLGNPVREIVDINFQSGPDQVLPARLHVYSAVLHFRFGVPVRSVAVLLRPKADGTYITGTLSFGESAHRVEFRYAVVRMWDQPVEPFLEGGLGLLPLATLCRMSEHGSLETGIENVFRRIQARLQREATDDEANRFLTATFILAGLRIDRRDLLEIVRGVPNMAEMCAVDQWLEDGRIDGYVRMLLRQGRIRFGEFDRDTETAIRDIKDPDRLERLIDAILTVGNWNELLETR